MALRIASIERPQLVYARAMQDALFPIPEPTPAGKRRARAGSVQPAATTPESLRLAAILPPTFWLGTSSWNYPGWKGTVWAEDYEEAKLSKQGLSAYAQHPLLRAVSLDRAFYRPLSAAQYAAYAAQVPDAFRFVVKAPSLVADALVRDEGGRGLTINPHWLNGALAASEYAQPALEGLGAKLGALVFQLSPLPRGLLTRMDEVIERLAAMLAALPSLSTLAPDAVVAVEVRDARFLDADVAPAFIRALRENGATYALGGHAKMPSLEAQLPVLRALWPGPLVCRWNLNSRHGAYGYEDAKQLYAPFDRIVDADLETRATLAKVIVGTVRGGQRAYVTIGNKAEGSAPLSVVSLAEAVGARFLATP